jgi:hypothetical protein
MTAPVPPAHLSFIDGIFFFRPLCGSSLKTMILASCPPSSMTEFTSGCSFSTASETAVTSCTNFAPIRRDAAAARARDEHAAAAGRDAQVVLEPLQELERLLGLLRLVPLVIRPRDRVGERIHGHGLDGRGPDVDADQIGQVRHVTPSLGRKLCVRARLGAVRRTRREAREERAPPLSRVHPIAHVQHEGRRRAGDAGLCGTW